MQEELLHVAALYKEENSRLLLVIEELRGEVARMDAFLEANGLKWEQMYE